MTASAGRGRGDGEAKRSWRKVHGILLLDKPAGCSSNQALQRARRLFGAEKAGHTGSLDPLATGMLPLCFGSATRVSAYLLDSDKRYFVRAALGAATDTGDAEGQVIARSHRIPGRAELEAVLPQFRGLIRQVPPMHSALKHEGQPLYKLARQGIEIERAPREVTIHGLDLLAVDGAGFELDVRCSKGTYVRSLVQDMAIAAGSLAHVTVLRRTEVAPFSALTQAWDFARLEALALQGMPALDAILLSPLAALAGWPVVDADADAAFHLGRGQAVRLAGAPGRGPVAIRGPAGELLGIGEIDDAARVAPRRWLAGA